MICFCWFSNTFLKHNGGGGGAGSRNMCSSPCFVNLSCAQVGLVLVPQMCFCFVGLPFFPSASWPLSFLSLFPLFFLFLRPCLIHARMPDWGRAFVHGHTFLHSWSGPMTLVVGLLRVQSSSSSFRLNPIYNK